ncbi:tudor domain-containing protein 15 isoform X2 [Numida meleagris]|nr:tudor domain-containing protein 15 isoform X2 [Numida meleagris]XP_021248257.1 tudor domain-containing protein 15 isoform X2 [Numida meleagris]XP_021248258.1 tudor domain-containing protein 15 isoform X2 [Numida meleagris]
MESLTPSPAIVDMNLKIIHTECSRQSLLVAFKGERKGGCELDYHILQQEIQRVFKAKDNVVVGGSCFVEDKEGSWFRGKVLEKRGNFFKTFLLDTGQVIMVEEAHVASACDKFFQLPPMIVWGIFANIVPLGEKWGPKAINYFSSLVGLEVAGRVKAVTSCQMFIVEVPKIISDVLELQLGKLIDRDSFCLIVEVLEAFSSQFSTVPQFLQQKCSVQELLSSSNFVKPSGSWLFSDVLFPNLPADSKVSVKITTAESPSKFYCQIQKWQKELEHLTQAMCLYYEDISTKYNTHSDSLGQFCAAKRKNGQWHRGVIRQLLPDLSVEVWFMDFGNIEAVPSSCVWKLLAEFMSLPMTSFPCALSCLGNQDKAVIKHQLKKLAQALIGQNAVCVCVNSFDAIEHLYYVTLPDEDFGINTEHPEKLNEGAALSVSPLETKITSIGVSCKARAVCFTHGSHSSCDSFAENRQTKNCVPEWSKSSSSYCKRVEMQINSSHAAFVVYVLNPSNFWIQPCAYQNEFQALTKNIAGVYNQCGAEERVLKNPEPGWLCCARYSKDGHYYRGIVTEVLDVNVTVYFLDFGNTDIVPSYDVKTLLPEFSDLPALAMCCELACAFPVDDIWVKKENDFFREVVSNRLLMFQVIGKQNNKYIVNASYRTGSQECSVATLMVQAGFADYWERRSDSALNVSKKFQDQNHHRSRQKHVNAKCTSSTYKNNISQYRQIFQKEKTLSMPVVLGKTVMLSSFGKEVVPESHKSEPEEKIHYKEFVFKPGAVFEVVCSCSVSPADFSCQLQNKLPELATLMKQIQTYYKEHTHPYETGQIACVVKCPKDGKWYRATVVQQVSSNEVDVIFVDYGYRERVVLNDLQAILPDFLTLESQAFHCALKNVPLQTDAFNWPEDVCRRFRDFISASAGPLTCTVCALVLLSPSSLCNIVDLQTPFVGAEEFLRECGLNHSDCIEFQRLVPLGSLYSFFYSTFNIKIGSEEEVYITHIHSFSKFYCQLNRNTETIEALMKKANETSKLSDHTKCYTSNMRLCIARYFEDGLFYRALVSPMKLTSYLHADFVDFGNKQITERDQVMPLPDSATDLIFTPMQAVKCRLSDFREKNVPAGVIRWFEETFLGKLLKAVVVSIESSGQIVVELYDEQLRVGQKIEEKILEESAVVTDYTEQFAGRHRVMHCVEGDKVVSERNAKNCGRIKSKSKRACEVHKRCQTDTGQNFGDEEQSGCGTHELHSKSSRLLSSEDREEPVFQKTVSSGLEHREKPLDGKPASVSQCHPSDLNKITINALSESFTERQTNTGQQGRSNENVSELTSLPPRDIQVNSEVEGCISHINSLSSFYIQFVEDEKLIIQLEEELNESVVSTHCENGLGELREGDLVVAERAADGFYYRAVIKALKSGNSCEVEFIDYGNTAVVSPSKICGIQRKLLTFLRLSIHCFLSRVKTDESWTDEGTSYFLSKINDKPFTCKFIEQHGEQWEVDIVWDGKSMAYDLQQRKGKTGLQNKPVHNWESIPQQIQVTNDSPQDRKSTDGLGGERENHAAKMKNISETHLDIPSQDLNSERVERAEIMNVSVSGEFNVQLVRNLQILNKLNVMLVKEAQVSGLLTVENIEEGLECMTKSERNLKWYRSKVIKMFIRERLMLVCFIDYGNYEVVSLNNAKILSNEIKSIPKQAVFCEWVWFKKLNIPFVPVVNALLNREIRILFLRYLESSHIWEVEILIGQILLIEYLSQPLSLCQTIRLEKSSNADRKELAKSFRINSITWTPLQSGRRYPGFATMVTDPSNFCVQFEDLFDCMKKLTLLLSDVPENLPALPEELVAPGTSCLIQFGLEAQWNRAEISEVTSQSVVLSFVDYGFLKSIPYSAIHRLKVIPEALSYLPRMVYSCSLHGTVPAAGEYWSNEAKVLFQELLGKPGLMFCFNHYGSGMRLEVDVLYEESNLAHALVAAGHAVYSTSGCSLIPVDRTESTKLHLQPNTNSNCSRIRELDYN